MHNEQTRKKFESFRSNELAGRVTFREGGQEGCFFWEEMAGGEIYIDRGWWIDPEVRMSPDELRRFAQEFAREIGLKVTLEVSKSAGEERYYP